jgi:hypothetical protein
MYIHCSSGDRDPLYRQCIRQTNDGYRCMMDISHDRLSQGLPMLQYYGHWPYLRIFGVQEPAACLFSLANIVPHLARLWGASSRRSSNSALSLFPVVHIVAWLASATYHYVKTDMTTRIDYAAAFVLISFSVWVALLHLLPLHWWLLRRLAAISMTVLSIIYVFNMLSGSISHGQHMNVCVPLTVLHSILWYSWCAKVAKSRDSVTLCVVCNVWLALSATFEIFDFPPIIYILDAHAVWHMLTVPLSVIWYLFWDSIENDDKLIDIEVHLKSS